MRSIAISTVLAIGIFSLSTFGQSNAKFETIGELGWALTQAYSTRALGTLDAKMPAYRRVKIVIENSLAEDDSKDKLESKTFRNLAEADKWLISNETSLGFPSRIIYPLIKCKLPKCTYDVKGLHHFQLILKSFTYDYRNRRPYIKSIYLVDGN